MLAFQVAGGGDSAASRCRSHSPARRGGVLVSGTCGVIAAAAGTCGYPALAEAAHHDDLEIRLRARAILVDLRERHLLADVDPAVARIMQNYATLPLDIRRERVEQLTSILPQQGVELVARLTQFEEDESLAESAVTAVLACRLPDSWERQRELASPVLQATR